MALNLLDFYLGQDRSGVEAIRPEARRGEWLCRQCRQEVEVRAGEKRRWYFAHKELADCPSANESAPLRRLRECLYVWLNSKFPDRVSIEHLVPDSRIPRPIDCWIEPDPGVAGSRPISFWIQPTQLRGESARRDLRAGLRDLQITVRWILAAGLMRGIDDGLIPGGYSLSPTEREFIAASRYDKPDPIRSTGVASGSLHYLEPNERGGVLTTLRALRSAHPPQIFSADHVQSPLTEMLVTSQGELVHPGEHESYEKWRAAASTRNVSTSPRPARPGPLPESGPEVTQYQSREAARQTHLDKFAEDDWEVRREPSDPAALPLTERRFRCVRCGAEVEFGAAQVIETGPGTCTCNNCFWKDRQPS